MGDDFLAMISLHVLGFGAVARNFSIAQEGAGLNSNVQLVCHTGAILEGVFQNISRNFI